MYGEVTPCGYIMATEPERPKYRWPWLVLLAVLVGIVLAVLWMSHEVERTKRIRDANMPGKP